MPQALHPICWVGLSLVGLGWCLMSGSQDKGGVVRHAVLCRTCTSCGCQWLLDPTRPGQRRCCQEAVPSPWPLLTWALCGATPWRPADSSRAPQGGSSRSRGRGSRAGARGLT
ncbi:hypothetical protein V8C86DRAFT_2517437 [Haematococcus lacustris]